MQKASCKGSLGPGKTIAALSIVIGCFAILWPKMFYPMLMTAFKATYPDSRKDGDSHSSWMPDASSAAPKRPLPKRPFPDPRDRTFAPKQPASSNTAINIFVPFYTLILTGFFLYTILKIICKKDENGGVLSERKRRFIGEAERRLLQHRLTQLAAHASLGDLSGEGASLVNDNNNVSVHSRNGEPGSSLQSATQLLIQEYGKGKVLGALNVLLREIKQEALQRQKLAKEELSTVTESTDEEDKAASSSSKHVDDVTDHREKDDDNDDVSSSPEYKEETQRIEECFPEHDNVNTTDFKIVDSQIDGEAINLHSDVNSLGVSKGGDEVIINDQNLKKRVEKLEKITNDNIVPATTDITEPVCSARGEQRGNRKRLRKRRSHHRNE